VVVLCAALVPLPPDGCEPARERALWSVGAELGEARPRRHDLTDDDVDRRWSPAVSKRTFQPNNRRRAKTHGFRLRMRTRAGRAIISARRRKGRSELSA
jgi:large subunit ribosomal protein L34